MSESSNAAFNNPLQVPYKLAKIYICFILLIVVTSSVTARPQATRDLSRPLVTSNTLDSARYNSSPPQTQNPTATATVPTTTGDSFVSSTTSRSSSQSYSASTQPAQLQPPKSLKFTLIAGKYWKFNIKTNSFQDYRQKELRLHRNLSATNYIIDDDGWFQYNHQQQQLFAWPSYNTKPATYYFVLLPSGLDYEADGENSIRIEDVVANIVVELIEPYTTSKLDLDHLVDHKFSLDYLHRHSSYPLLLSQIVSIFEILARGGPSQKALGTTQPANAETITTTTAGSSILLATLQLNKQARSSSRLSEFLLIDAQASQDGEYFSITWTTHSSLVNNAPLLPINECRLNTINETISKLSSRSSLYPNVDNNFVISYSLEGPLVNSAAIIPTEKGNYALKLSLNRPCRRKKVVDELGLSSESGIFNGLSSEADDKENTIGESRENLRTKQIPVTTPTSQQSSAQSVFALPELGGINTIAPIESTLSPALSIIQTDSYSQAHSTRDFSTPFSVDILTTHHSSRSTPRILDAAPPPRGLPSNRPSAIETEVGTTNVHRAHEISNTQASLTEAPTPTPPPHLEFSPQHQPKSFVNFLEPTNRQTVSTIMASISNSVIPSSPPTNSISIRPTATPATLNINATASTISFVESGQETSLNDDLMGILNDTMEYLVSIAVPLSILLGVILVASILIAICSLCKKRRKSKQFEMGDRFKFRYGSERKGFLKNSSKPVILEADQKSLSMGGTPIREPRSNPGVQETDKMLTDSKVKSSKKSKKSIPSDQRGSNFFSMHVFPTNDAGHSSGIGHGDVGCADFGAGPGGSGGCDSGGGGGNGGGD